MCWPTVCSMLCTLYLCSFFFSKGEKKQCTISWNVYNPTPTPQKKEQTVSVMSAHPTIVGILNVIYHILLRFNSGCHPQWFDHFNSSYSSQFSSVHIFWNTLIKWIRLWLRYKCNKDQRTERHWQHLKDNFLICISKLSDVLKTKPTFRIVHLKLATKGHAQGSLGYMPNGNTFNFAAIY